MNSQLDISELRDADAVHVRAYLAALPDAVPSNALWQRLQQQQQQRTARRALRPWLAVAATVTVAVIAAALLPRTPDASLVQHPSTPPGIEEPVHIDPAGRASLARIDAELERAYAANASDEALQVLLDVRAGVVDGLAAGESPQLLQL